MENIKLEDHILIINIPPNIGDIEKVVEEIQLDESTRNKGICLIDEHLEELPVTLQKKRVVYVRGNPTNESVLKQAAIERASYAIVLSKNTADSHSDDTNLAVVLMMGHLNKTIYSVVEVTDPQKVRSMELAGCSSAICVNQFLVNLVVQELQDPGSKTIIQELTSNAFGQQIYLIDNAHAKPLTYREVVLAGLDNNYSVFGFLRDKTPYLNPSAKEIIEPSDKIAVVKRHRVNVF